MVSDSIINASIPNAAKDFAKKKRANRSSAKLKQHKLHTRREQWLSQGQVKNKDCNKEEVMNGGEFHGPMIETRNQMAPRFKDLEVRSPSVEEIHHDSDSDLSPGNSPTSSTSGGNDSGNNYTGSSSSISGSSFSSVGCCSGSITEEEEGGGGGDDGCLDDWEAMADALVAEDKQDHNPNDEAPNKESVCGSGSTAKLMDGNTDAEETKSKLEEGAGILGRGVVGSKAWRADDAFRPQSLPNLSKQRSFPANSERKSSRGINPWVRSNAPTSCPICCEDLDLTDTSFLPCSCGFRLCLFCHKRILEEDGRCPGCRKPYAADPVEKETSVSGGSLTIRLARSCSMFSRV